MAEKTPGLWIEIDGIDGAGKSEQVGRLEERLKKLGLNVLKLRNPGGDPSDKADFGEKVREIALSNLVRPAKSDLFLFAAANHRNIALGHTHRLNGGTVIMDRGLSSFNAYQGSQGIARRDLSQTLEMIQDVDGVQAKPDVHLVLTVKPEVAAERLAGVKLDYWESQPEEFKNRVRASYEACLLGETLIDSNGTIEEVEALIWSHIEPKLGGNR